MNYQAEMDRIVAEYTAASRSVINRFLDTDARTMQSGAELFETLRHELVGRDEQSQESPEEKQAREARAEHDRMLCEAAARARTTAAKHTHARDNYVLPSDWTDEDEAREEGYGPPKSWLI
ncbi:hypothetical protein [Nocardia pneumoniae]|uniref:hypothetical protein n=1 Tax=Nocardia pneumoniae TaxID=228601 RepID=UPI0002FABBBC|nr:hypothetical protein [Nocardia pneumoniae]